MKQHKMKKMIVKVPKNLDVPELLSGETLTPTRRKNLTYKIFRLVSRLVITHKNHQNFKGGYIRICTREFKKILGHDYPYVRNLLINKKVIEKINDWKPGGKCNRYALSVKYQISKYEFKTIYVRTTKDIKETYLLDKFFNEKLQIADVDNLIAEIIHQIEERGLKNHKQEKVFKNIIGIWIQNINDLNQEKYWFKRSSSNNRYNTTLTNLKKIFRNHIKYDKQDLVQIDVKSSQVYLLASMLNKEFFKSNNEFSYNSFKEQIVENKELVGKYVFSPLMAAQFSRDKKDFAAFIRQISKPTNEGTIDIYGFQKFREAPFSNDFYSHLYYLEHETLPTPKQRREIKNDMMFILFQDLYGHRKRVQGVRILKKHYPSVNRLIEYLLDKIGKRDFALLLQRIESYLVLDCIVPRFHDSYPDAPIFTIHDSVITTKPYVEGLKNIMHNTLFETTGIEPGLSVEELIPEQIVPEHAIEELIESIEKSSRIRRFRAYERTILDRNIRYADEFISNLNNRRE